MSTSAISASGVDFSLHQEIISPPSKAGLEPPLERDFNIDIWDDGKLKAGSNWKQEIETALAAAKLAVLLISADFLASDFIYANELPPLLEAAKKEGATILPVIVSPCRFLRIPDLAQFQSINDPNNSLIEMSKGEQERVFVNITEYMKQRLSLGRDHEQRISQNLVRVIHGGMLNTIC